ncbi:MAG: ThiF family adenylyltransferase [Victivallaceae bacterium]|nr:ThiF family adenylyltransferase [Victivallaceae bacterium]
MWLKMFSKSRLHKCIKTKKIESGDKDIHSVADRQKRLPEFSQEAIENTHILSIGGGGLGSEIGEGLARKGIEKLTFYDDDFVELSNLNRQHFFKNDIGKNKAVQLVKNLAKHATCGTIFTGYGCRFQDAVILNHDLNADVVICGVDNNSTRVAVSEYYRKRNIPVIFLAVDYKAEAGYVFVQEPGGPCFGCAFPHCLEKRKAPCFSPAVKDILKVVAGIALYAVDTLIMERKCNWNYRDVHLAGFAPSQELIISRNPKCPLCNKN